MWLFLLFVLVPLVEIALFITVGGWLTLWPTLAIVLATAVAGTWLVRRQGLQVLRDIERAFERLDDPLAPLAHGLLVLVAGVLLLTPGFLTDAVGLLLLVPAVRVWLLGWAARHRIHARVHARRATVGPMPGGRPAGSAPDGTRRPGEGEIIEAEFRDLSEPDEAPQAPDRRAGGAPRRG